MGRHRSIGERIRALRRRYKLTRIQLAATVGVSLLTVGRWERGETRPSPLALARLRALGL
jgi:DNA-binding transcriptional regulator YiaG